MARARKRQMGRRMMPTWVGGAQVQRLVPDRLPRVLLTHTRPEPFLGMLRRLDTGPATTTALGFINHGGTMDAPGLLFANRCTWAHVLEAAAFVLGLDRARLLDTRELAAIDGVGDPATILHPVLERRIS